MPESPAGKGTQYTQQNRKALQADPSHYKYLQNEVSRHSSELQVSSLRIE